MTKIFISLPRERDEFDYLKAISIVKEKITKDFKGKKYEIVDPTTIFPQTSPDTTGKYLSDAIMILSSCEYCYFEEGWESSEECKIINSICETCLIRTVVVNKGGKRNERLRI